MSKDFPRHQRIGDQIQRELSDLIRLNIKDPRLADIVTVAEVRLSPDFSQAKIFISVLNGNGKETVEILNSASGFLRKQLGKRLHIRVIPTLIFIYDTLAEDSAHLSELIDKAVNSDKDKHVNED